MKKLILIITLLAIIPAFSQDRGWYLGAGAGTADKDNADKENLVEVFAGYNFGRYFALETGYLSFDEFKSSSNTRTLETDATGIKLIALGKVPIGSRFVGYAGAGVLFSDTDELIRIDTEVSNRSEQDVGGALEAGIQFKITDHWALDFEYGGYSLGLYNFKINTGQEGVVVDIDDQYLTTYKTTISYRF